MIGEAISVRSFLLLMKNWLYGKLSAVFPAGAVLDAITVMCSARMPLSATVMNRESTLSI